MSKLQFLCANHRRWLSDNPTAAISTWAQSYSRALELSEERDYRAAANHAGAAFETAEIAFGQIHPVSDIAIHRFSDSGVLLAQLLYRLGDKRQAGDVLGASVSRLEQLLMAGVEHKAVLGACQRLLRVGDELSPVATRRAAAAPGAAAATLH